MPIDPARALAASLPDVTATWDPDDVILYHLGVEGWLLISLFLSVLAYIKFKKYFKKNSNEKSKA